MTGEVLHAFCDELMADTQLGLRQVQIERNFSNSNPPQNVLPAAIVGILDSHSEIFVGGFERREYTVGIWLSLLDVDIDLKHSRKEVVRRYRNAYDIIDRLQTLFNVQEFSTDSMNALQSGHNLITRSRGYNKRHTPYDTWSKNVVTYELAVRALVTVPHKQPDVPIEQIEYEFEIQA